MATLSPETLDRLNKFKSSDKFKSLSPETQARLDGFLSSSSPAVSENKATENPLATDKLTQFRKGLYEQVPFMKRLAELDPEYKAKAEAVPEAQGLGAKVARGLGEAAPTIVMAAPFVSGGSALAQGAKFIPQAAKGVAGSAIGFGAFEGTKAAVKGEKDKMIPEAIGGAASGALLGAGGQIGSNLMSKFAPALKYGANVGTAAGQAAVAGAMAPEGDKETQAIIAGGLGLISPISPIKGKTPQEKLTKYAETYRNVLAPSKGDIKNVEVLSGKNLDDYYKLAAKEGLIIKSTSDGKINTEPARNKLEEQIKPLNEQINSIISSDKVKQFNLNDVKNRSKVLLRKTFKNDLDYKKSLQILDDEIAAAKEAHGDIVDGVTLNTIKQGMWAKGYDALNPNSKPAAREIGNVAKNMIEDAYPTADIKGLNKKLGDYYTLDALLETAHGRVIQKGKLGRYVSQGIGAAAGAPIPYVGPFAGGYAGGKVHDILTSPEAITTRTAKNVSKLGLKEENISTRKGVAEPEIVSGLRLPAPRVMGSDIRPQLNQNQIIYSENPIKGLPSPQSVGISEAKTLGKGQTAQGEGFTVIGGKLNKGEIKSTRYEIRTTPDAKPMKVYVDKEGRHFVYEGDLTNPTIKYLDNKTNNIINNENKLLNNPVAGEFNPLSKKNITKGALSTLAISAGLSLSSGNAEASTKIKNDDIQRYALDPLSYTKTEEGFRGKIYRDTKGKKTIGYGFNIEEPFVKAMLPKDVINGRRQLTKEEAEPIFRKLYSKAQMDAKIIAGNGWSKMNDKQKQVLSDMVYNMGLHKVNGFKDMKAAIRSGNWNNASKEILDSDYARKDAPNRARRNSYLMKLVNNK